MLLITSVFDFLDIAIVNSKILYHNTDSAPLLSTTDFRYCTVLLKRWFSIFQARKERFPGQRSNQLDNTLVMSIICLIMPPLQLVVHYVQDKKNESHTFVWCALCNVALCLQKKMELLQKLSYKMKHFICYIRVTDIYF